MKNFNLKTEWIFWVVMAIPVVYGISIWKMLPGQIPVHFDMYGTPNGYASKEIGIVALPGINLLAYILLLAGRSMDPYKINYEKFERSFFLLRLAVCCLLSILFFISMEAAMQHPFGNPQFLMASLFLFFIVFGNFMKTVKPNFFIGVRTPWTLMNQDSWKKTHALLGKIWFYGGLAGLAVLLLAGKHWTSYYLIVFILGSLAVAVIGSYLYYRKSESVSS